MGFRGVENGVQTTEIWTPPNPSPMATEVLATLPYLLTYSFLTEVSAYLLLFSHRIIELEGAMQAIKSNPLPKAGTA